MRILPEFFRAGAVAPTRVVLLPAAYTFLEDFQKEGFVAAVRDRGLPLDLSFVELKLEHLTDRSILERLRHEVVLPARASGCTLWLGGISLGGFVALAYVERYPREIDGLCVLAPYLGDHRVTGEIQRANGVAEWTPGELADDDDERRIWRFIKMRRAWPGRLHLGYGCEDRFAASHRLMATALGPESVDTVPGGHDWPAWRLLWRNFLDRQIVATGPATAAARA
jgi:pimeloyl-ACP methyl ester carboxylesterase